MAASLLEDRVAFREFLARLFIMAIGLLLNGSIVLVTIKNKKLRSHCNLLIAFEAGFCALYQLNGFATLAIALFANNGLIGLRICCLLIQPAFVFGFYSYATTLLLVALDRLSSILFPFWYMTRKTSIYLLIMFMACSISGVYNLQGKFRWALEDAQEKTLVQCQQNNCNGGDNSALSHNETSIIVGLTVIAYIVLWIVLLFAKGNSAESKANIRISRKIFRALAFLVLVYSFFTFGTAFVNSILDAIFHDNPDIYRQSVFILGLLANASYSISMPALFAFSSDYRNAYKQLFSTTSPIMAFSSRVEAVFHQQQQQ